jgi:hypothetical protein
MPAESAQNASDPISRLTRLGEPVLVASHFRSGTHLLMDLIRRQFPPFRPRMKPLESIHASYLSIDRFDRSNHRPLTPDAALDLLAKADRATLKTHALPGFADVRPDAEPFVRALVERSDILYAVRDGRDVMCSMHAWMRSFRSDTPDDFAAFCFDPLPSGSTRAREWNDHAIAWLDTPNVRVVRFERIVRATADVLAELADALDATPAGKAPLLPRPIKSVRAAWTARLIGNVESTNVHSAGIPPLRRDEAFTPELNQRFLDEAGEAMTRLAYT